LSISHARPWAHPTSILFRPVLWLVGIGGLVFLFTCFLNGKALYFKNFAIALFWAEILSSGLFVICKRVLNSHVIVHLLVHTFDTSSQFMTSSKPAVSAQKFASGKCF